MSMLGLEEVGSGAESRQAARGGHRSQGPSPKEGDTALSVFWEVLGWK